MIIFNNDINGHECDHYYIEDHDSIAYEVMSSISFMESLTENMVTVVLEDSTKTFFDKVKEFFKHFLKLAKDFFEDIRIKFQKFNATYLKSVQWIKMRERQGVLFIGHYSGIHWKWPADIKPLTLQQTTFTEWLDQYTQKMITRFDSNEEIDPTDILSSTDIINKLLEVFGITNTSKIKTVIDRYYIINPNAIHVSLGSHPIAEEMINFIDQYPRLLDIFSSGRKAIETLCDNEISKCANYEQKYTTKLEGESKSLFLKMISNVISANRIVCTLNLEIYRHLYATYKHMFNDFIRILLNNMIDLRRYGGGF